MLLRLLFIARRLLRPISLWIFRRFTPVGWCVLAGTVVCATIGVDTDHTMAYQLFSFLAASLMISLLVSCRFPIKLEAERVLPRFATAGVATIYPVRWRNTTRRPQGNLLLRDELAPLPMDYASWRRRMRAEDKKLRRRWNEPIIFPPRPKLVSGLLPTASPGGWVETHLSITPAKRGVLRLGSVMVARPDPLGLCYALARQALPQSLVVLPHRYPLPPLSLPGNARHQPGGVALAGSVGESEEFVGLRDYRPGDPLRHIHWRSWARLGKPIVKEFEEENFVRHALVLDTFLGEQDEAVFEEAVSVAASFACSVDTQESLLDLVFVGTRAYCFTAGHGVGQAAQLLEVLAGAQVSDEPPETLHETLVRHLPQVTGCIYVMLGWDAKRTALWERVRALGVPSMGVIVAEAGEAESVRKRLPADLPATWVVVEVGAIAEGLLALGAMK